MTEERPLDDETRPVDLRAGWRASATGPRSDVDQSVIQYPPPTA